MRIRSKTTGSAGRIDSPGIIYNNDLELIVKCTLKKMKQNNIHHPMMLCVVVVEATHDQVETLKQMIDSEHLLKDYIIYRQCNKFYLEWK